MGGKDSGWHPHTVRHEGDVHWFLARWVNEVDGFNSVAAAMYILDPTAQQFESRPPYRQGTPRGFLTREPSKRARALMDRILWSDRDAAVVASPQVNKVRGRKPAQSRPGRRGTRAARR